ncbi:acyltransferase family protein [Bifidobacterium tissieri]|uniref:Acyltransferase 3 domain-containing protein n=1 Tax=Bifidobacterium tissieri TaxID=1630162 RepID=A0A5M9ZP81_9BIFI|nr:acyltransferase family protein [Bifidobacterium tissieri]KAA8829305.1 hypothetical protein EMO89_08415 [Bifidobacterium tissieri]KAA8831909.1 hypothetical protein EM849_06630 [Bifidobacterium tissieri]
MGARLTYMDVAKGIGILAVVIGHVVIDYGGGRTPFVLALYTFHLPLFFIVSGYFFTYRPGFKAFLAKKCRAYLIPYAFAAALITVFEIMAQSVLGDRPVTESASYMLLGFVMQRRFTTLWFLAALLLGELMFWLLFRFVKSMPGICVASLVIGLAGVCYSEFVRVPIPWNLDAACVVVLYLAIGAMLKRHDAIAMLERHRWRNVCILTAVSVVCTLINLAMNGEPYEMFASQYGVFPLTIVAACAGSFAVILLSSGLRGLISDGLSWLGRNTMVFFMLHKSIAMPIMAKALQATHLDVAITSISGNIGLAFVIFLGVMIICCAIRWCIFAVHLGVLLGRTNWVQKKPVFRV